MISIIANHWQDLLYGLGQTLLCSILALFFSLIIGSFFAIFEVVPSKTLRIIARVYIEIFETFLYW